MKKITLLVLFLSTLWGYSQIKNYTFTQSTGTYAEISGTSVGGTLSDQQYFTNPATLASGSNTGFDGPGIPIGFSFMFNGYNYDRFGINANGWIALGSSAITPYAVKAQVSSGSSPLSTTLAITPEVLSARISPLGADLQAQTGASIQFLTTGEAPNRVLTVQWKNYRKYNATAESFNFQIRLTETTNTVEFIYGAFTTSAAAKTFMVGMRADINTGNTNFVNRTATTGWDNTNSGTAVANTVTLTDVIKPVSGLTYKWTPGTCADPKNLTASNITTSGATLSWDAYVPTPVGYEYNYSTSATLPMVAGTAVIDPTVNVTDLTPNTKYYVFARSVCGTDFSQWINIGNFKTKCLDQPLFSEDFDAYAMNGMPDCWASAGNGSTYITTGGASPGSAPNRLYMSATSSGTATVSYAILPAVPNLKAGTHRLKFKVYATTANRTFDVGYIENINDLSTFTSLQTINLPSPAAVNAQEFIVIPPDTIPAGVKNLVFKNAGAGSTNGATTLYIDDVIWQVNPPCTDLTKVLVKLPTSTSINVSWDVTGTETAWQYAVSPSTVTDPATLPAESFVNVDFASVTVDAAFPNTRTFTVNNLTPNTSYKIWVRSKCGDSAFGYWLASPTFLTSCTSVATINEDFDLSTNVPDCWRVISYAPNSGNISVAAAMGTNSTNALKLVTPVNNSVFIATPPLSTALTGGYRMKFKYKASNANSVLEVFYYKDPTVLKGPGDYVVFFTKTITAANTEYTFNEMIPVAGTVHMGLRVYNTSATITAYIDDFVWEPIPACPDVTAIAVNGISAESVNLGWTTIGTENDWQYAVTNANMSNPILTAVDFDSPFINGANVTSTISGLTPSTSYKFWIRTKCTENDYGAWIGPYYFKTNCIATEGFVQNFDASTDFPACWSKIGSVNTIVVQESGTSNNILKIEGSTSAKSVVHMQPVSNSNAGSHILRFKLSGSVVGAKVEVGYTTNASDPSKFTPLRTFSVASTTTYSIESVDLAFEPGSQVLAFRNPGTSTTANTIYIDDVVWEALPACLDVSSMVVTGITSSTIDLKWKKGGTEAAWQYIIANSSITDPKDLTVANFVSPVIDETNISSSISGLTPSTSYNVWIRSKCSTGSFGVWVGPYTFTTTCAPVDKFTEKFDVNTNIPACWKNIGTGAVAVVPITGASEPNALKLESTATAKAMIIMPPVNNAASATNRLRFKFRSSVANKNIQIGYLTNIADPNSFQLMESIAAPVKDVYYAKVVNLGTNPIGELLVFKNPDVSVIYIDDLTWEPIPSCLDVTGVTPIMASSNSAELSWIAGGSETEWQYAVGTPTDTNPDLLTAVDFVSPIVTGSNVVGDIISLTPSTPYKVWIRSKCTHSVGVWTDPVTFGTSCAPVSAFQENFDVNTNLPACWRKTNNNVTVIAKSGASGPNVLSLYATSATNQALAVMPPVNNAALTTHRLRFKVKSAGSNGTLEVGYMSGTTTFVVVKTLTGISNTDFENRVVDFGTDFTSEELAFRNPGAVSSTIYIDNVNWEPKPNCLDVSALATTSVKANSTDIKWIVGGTETAWQYVKGSATDMDPDLLTAVNVDSTNSTLVESNVNISISDLSPNTAYKVWVRSKCADDISGIWMGPLSFKTICGVVTSISEHFDSNNTAMPDCWYKVGTKGTVNVATVSGAPSGSYALHLKSTSQSDVAVAAFPTMSGIGDGTHMVKFSWRAPSVPTGIDFGYLTNPADASSFVTIKSYAIKAGNTFQTEIYKFEKTPASQIFAFRKPGYNQNDIYFDNVSVEPLPAAAPATAITATPSECGNNATKIEWAESAYATGYKLTIGTTSGGSDVMNNQAIGNVLSYYFYGNLNAKYYFTLTPYNGLGDAVGCIEQSFTTNQNSCYCISAPTDKDGTGITNVMLNAANFPVSSVTYADLTSKKVNLVKVANSKMNISFSTAVAYNAYVWIDFDDDLAFEPTEIVFTGKSAATATTVLDAGFTLPETATAGMHRMRIVSTSENLTPANPCYSGAKGVTVDMQVNVVDSLVNDVPSGATVLTKGTQFSDYPVTTVNVNATGSIAEPNPTCGNYNGADVWYSAAVPSSGDLTFELKTITGSIDDLGAAVYSGTSDNLTPISCMVSNNESGIQPKIVLTERTAGENLYLRVWENGGDAYGSFQVAAYDPIPGSVLVVDTFDLSNFNFYPNPVKDVLNLSMDQQITDVAIFNLLGQVVISKSVNATEAKIDMSGLTQGTYLVRITTADQSKTVKVIKQ